MSDIEQKQERLNLNNQFIFTRNRLWECMKTTLTYSWQCLIYTDRERKNMRIKIYCYDIATTIIPVILFALLAYCMIAKGNEIYAWISVSISLLNAVLTLAKNSILPKELHGNRMEEIDNLGKDFKAIYRIYSDIFISNCMSENDFDFSVNKKISELIKEQDEKESRLNKLTYSFTKKNEEKARARADKEMTATFIAHNKK